MISQNWRFRMSPRLIEFPELAESARTSVPMREGSGAFPFLWVTDEFIIIFVLLEFPALLMGRQFDAISSCSLTKSRDSLLLINQDGMPDQADFPYPVRNRSLCDRLRRTLTTSGLNVHIDEIRCKSRRRLVKKQCDNQSIALKSSNRGRISEQKNAWNCASSESLLLPQAAEHTDHCRRKNACSQNLQVHALVG